MTVTLNRSYANMPAGSSFTGPQSTEQALIAQGLAVNLASGLGQSGSHTNNATRGRAQMAAGTASVVITNPLCNTSSQCNVSLAQTLADTTANPITAVCSNGSIVFTAPANATAAVNFNWELVNVQNSLSPTS